MKIKKIKVVAVSFALLLGASVVAPTLANPIDQANAAGIPAWARSLDAHFLATYGHANDAMANTPRGKHLTQDLYKKTVRYLKTHGYHYNKYDLKAIKKLIWAHNLSTNLEPYKTPNGVLQALVHSSGLYEGQGDERLTNEVYDGVKVSRKHNTKHHKKSAKKHTKRSKHKKAKHSRK